MIVNATHGYELKLPEIRAPKIDTIKHNDRTPCQRLPPVRAPKPRARSQLYGFDAKCVLKQIQTNTQTNAQNDITTYQKAPAANGIIRPLGDLARLREKDEKARRRVYKGRLPVANKNLQPLDFRNYRYENTVNLMLNYNRLSFKIGDILYKYDDEQ